MKMILNVRKANRVTVASLTTRESSNVISTAITTKTPVTLKTARIWAPGVRKTSIKHNPIAIIVNGAETVESFLARGGAINVLKPTKVTEPTVRVKGSRNMANTQMKALRTPKSINGNQ